MIKYIDSFVQWVITNIAIVYYLYGGTFVVCIAWWLIYGATVETLQWPVIPIALVIASVVAQSFQSVVYWSNRRWVYRLKFLPAFTVFFATWLFVLVQVVWVFQYTFHQDYWEGYIDNLTWQFDVEISRWSPSKSTCWGHSCLPNGAYNATEKWEDTGRNRCWDVDDDDEECEDIYDHRWYYTINKFVPVKTLRTTGDWKVAPYYAEPKIERLAGDTETCPGTADAHGPNAGRLGCEKVSRRMAHYFYAVRVVSPSDVFSKPQYCEVTRGTWGSLSVEKAASGRYYAHQNLLACNTTHFKPLASWLGE